MQFGSYFVFLLSVVSLAKDSTPLTLDITSPGKFRTKERPLREMDSSRGCPCLLLHLQAGIFTNYLSTIEWLWYSEHLPKSFAFCNSE